MTEDERVAAIAKFMEQEGPLSEEEWLLFEKKMLADKDLENG